MFVGRDVTDAAALGQLGQVYRDPRYETLRVFFMKGDTIIHATGVSARLGGEAPLLPGGKDMAEPPTGHARPCDQAVLTASPVSAASV